MMKNKKGESSTIAVTIAIVLGVALVVFLIWGFSTNWAMFSSTTTGYGGKSNIDTVAQACDIKCEQVDEFCGVKKDVSYAYGDEIKKEELTCFEIKEKFPDKINCNTKCLSCSGTPTTAVQDAEQKDIPCTAKLLKSECDAYAGCLWK